MIWSYKYFIYQNQENQCVYYVDKLIVEKLIDVCLLSIVSWYWSFSVDHLTDNSIKSKSFS